jgi:hypothetical protein
VLRRPHVLLVTLLVCNACAAEALPLVLDRLANPLAAVVLSVTVVLFFGEGAGWVRMCVGGGKKGRGGWMLTGLPLHAVGCVVC